MSKSKAYIALPIMNEPGLASVLEDMSKQTYKNIEIFVCVNQPESYSSNPDFLHIYEQNQNDLAFLRKLKHDFPLHIIDKSSQGKAWTAKNHGVGWARKTLMDAIALQAGEKDVIISMDGDTHYPSHYIASIMSVFAENTKVVGLANPYFHPLMEGNEAKAKAINRAVLRYEIYMRIYAIHLAMVGHPYAFTAVGSAMAAPVWAYKKIGGLTPHKSGEDFYFLQKLAKIGKIETYSGAIAYPSPRDSQRVFFGTGPAIIKGMQNDWKSYPIYPLYLFENIAQTYKAFACLYREDNITYPLYDFMQEKFGEDWHRPLRENAKTQAQFEKNCVEKLDALRTLQYLKMSYAQDDVVDSENVKFLLQKLNCNTFSDFDFSTADIESLDRLRCFLVDYEFQNKIIPI